MKKYFYFFCAFLLAWCLVAAPVGPRSEWLGGYAKMEAAEKMEKENVLAAADLYKEALAVFESVRRKYPQWNPSLLNYRISYCQERIQAMTRKIEKNSYKLNMEELIQLVNQQARSLQALENGKKELESRVAFLSDALQRAREEAAKGANLESTAASMAAAKANLELRLAQVEARLKETENLLNEERRAGKDNRGVRQQLKEATRRTAVLETERQRLEAETVRLKDDLRGAEKATAQLQNQKLAVEEQLKASQARWAELVKGNTLLQNRLRSESEKLANIQSTLSNREIQIVRLQEQLRGRQAELDTLKERQKKDAATLAQLLSQKTQGDVARRQLEDLTGQIAALREGIVRKEKELKTREDEYRELQRQQEILRGREVTGKEQILSLTGQLARSNNRLTQVENQNAALTAQLAEMKLILEKRGGDLKNQEQMAAASQALQARVKILEQQLANQVALIRRQEQQLAEQQKKILEGHRSLESSRKESKNCEGKIAELRRQIGTLSAEKAQETVQLKREAEAWKGRAGGYEAEIATWKAKDRQNQARIAALALLEKELVAKKQAMAQAQEKQRALQGSLEKASLEQKQLEATLAQQTESLRIQAEQQKALQAQLQQARGELQKTSLMGKAELSRLQKELEARQNILTEKQKALMALEERYRQLEKSLQAGTVQNQATLAEERRKLAEALGKLKAQEKKIASLLEDIQLLRVSQQAMEGMKANVVEMTKEHQAQMQGEKRKLEKIQAEKAALEQEIRKLKEEMVALASGNKAALVQQLEESRRQMAQLGQEKAARAEAEKRLTAEAAKSAALEKEIASSKIVHTTILAKVSGLEKSLGEESKGRKEAEGQLKNANQLLAAQQRRQHEIEEQIRALNEKERALKENLRHKEEELAIANREWKNTKDALLKMPSFQEWTARLDQLQQKFLQEQMKALSLEGRLAGAQKQLAELKQREAALEEWMAKGAGREHQPLPESLRKSTSAQAWTARLEEAQKRTATLEGKVAGLERQLAAEKIRCQQLMDSMQKMPSEKEWTQRMSGVQAVLNQERQETRKSRQALAEAEKKFIAERQKWTQDLQNGREQLKALQVKLLQLQKEKDELSKLASGKNGEEWQKRLAIIQKKLEQEHQQRVNLENALVKLEVDRQNRSSGVAAAKTVNESEQAENRIRKEKEREMIVKGFLRQAIDAERKRKIEAARWNYQKALELDPENAFALKRLGLIAAAQGGDREAARYLKQAFLFAPDDQDTLLSLGHCMVRLGEGHWAVSMFGRAVALQPKNARAVRSYGAALMTLGWTQPAEMELKQAAKLDPKDAEAPFNLAVLLASAKPARLKEAKEWYAKALKNGAQADPGLDMVLR